jgi:hypothetical protein
MSSASPSSAIWRINRTLNAIALAGAILLLGSLIFAWASSFVSASFDPHGYLLIFGFVGGTVLLAMLFILILTALALRRRQRSGFVGQALLGAMMGLFGVAIPFAGGGWILITLGVLFTAPALAGILMTR